MDNKKGFNRTLSVILLAFLLYSPLAFLGFGTECGYYDSRNVINTAETLIQQHRYIPSRYPGFFVHEIFTALLFMLGGNLLTNLSTMVMSLLVIYFFIKICEYHSIPHRHLLAIFMIIHPLYYTASTFTIDYLWALGLFFIGYTLLIKKRYFIAGIFWGLAIGARLSSVLFVAILPLVYFLSKEQGRNKALLSLVIAAIIGANFYILSFLHAGRTFSFLTYYIGDWNWIGHLTRFIYKNIYFWGLQTCIAFLFLSPFIINGLKINYEQRYKNITAASTLIIIMSEVMYFQVPTKKHYLLPVLPFVLMLLGISLKRQKALLILLIIIQLSYNLVNINIARPDVVDNAATAKLGLWFERGYLINDIIDRIKTSGVGPYAQR